MSDIKLFPIAKGQATELQGPLSDLETPKQNFMDIVHTSDDMAAVERLRESAREAAAPLALYTHAARAKV